jgi:hypothetical protein
MTRITLIVGGLIAMLASAAAAADMPQHQTADGMEFYLGVVPAAIARGHPRIHPETQMHGGVPGGTFHVMVAVFDAASGARVADLEASARVSGLGLVGPRRALEPMIVGEGVTYGNYFALPGRDLYQIVIEARRPGAAPVRVEFAYDRRGP